MIWDWDDIRNCFDAPFDEDALVYQVPHVAAVIVNTHADTYSYTNIYPKSIHTVAN